MTPLVTPSLLDVKWKVHRRYGLLQCSLESVLIYPAISVVLLQCACHVITDTGAVDLPQYLGSDILWDGVGAGELKWIYSLLSRYITWKEWPLNPSTNVLESSSLVFFFFTPWVSSSQTVSQDETRDCSMWVTRFSKNRQLKWAPHTLPGKHVSSHDTGFINARFTSAHFPITVRQMTTRGAAGEKWDGKQMRWGTAVETIGVRCQWTWKT